MSGSLFFSITLRHHAWILYLFYGSPTSCPDPFSFWWIFGILSRSSIVLTTLWHCVWISFHFDGSPASCLDPLSFLRLFGIVSRSPIFSTALWHHARIPYLFGGSPTSCPDPLILNHCDPAPLAFGILMQAQNSWPLTFSLKFIPTHPSLTLRAHEPFVHSLY